MRRPTGHSWKATAIALVLLGAVLLARPEVSPGGGLETADSTASGTAPNFARADLHHRTVALAAYRGKVVLLNFWATWCGPCLSEVPRFADWQRRYGGPGGLQVIGVSMDDDEAAVRVACQKYGVNYPVIMGDAKLGQLYGGVLGLPVTFLIDRDGKIRFKHEGATDLGIIEHETRQLLARR